MIINRMNLKLFSEPPAETPTEPVPATEPQTEVPTEPESKTVPEATFLELKRKYKEERELRVSLQEKTFESDFLNKKQEIKQKLMATGEMSEAVANVQAEILAESFRATNRNTVQKSADEMLREELNDLATSPMYSDASEYFDKVKEKMDKVKGLSTAEALTLVKSNFRESERDFIQQQAVARRHGEEVQIPNAQPNPPKSNPFNLDETDTKALKNLQDMFPNGNWTPEKFAKNKKLK